tara:strand:+ start:10414 stop:12960 length:2547 start_codon:yes stop_codon:yes gene_type:complete
MDLTQRKLTKSEWESIELPVSSQEKKILQLIVNGYNNVNIHNNINQSLFSFVKIEHNESTELLLFQKYFETPLREVIKKYGSKTELNNITYPGSGGKLKSLKSIDKMRIQNLELKINENKEFIFEYILLDLASNMLKHVYKRRHRYAFYLYTILQLKKATITNLNVHFMGIIDKIVEYVNSFTKTSEIITNAYDFIEKNSYLLKYEDKTLFSHQKQLNSIFNNDSNKHIPKLILYTAPTGTGKTLSPIGLSNEYRIIFVCVARHIGLALAKSAISVEKKVAFAFGCETSSDIRLHYFSAVDYTRNKRSGGIGKVDNSVGTNVEIMICDVQSYITAMHYMLSFNEPTKIITYWDEPTITMDYKEHELHSIIHSNWMNNKIPNVVLSCATLPTEDELQPVFHDFKTKFDDANIHTITSYDCRKSISILNKEGYCVLPHYLYNDYYNMLKCARYCETNKTLLRYFDLREIIQFIEYVNKQNIIDDKYKIDSYFTGNISNITMNSLKEYYLDLLLQLDEEHWDELYKFLQTTKKRKFERTSNTIFKSNSLDSSSKYGSSLLRTTSLSDNYNSQQKNKSNGISITTSDAYTLTDGPTIFLADDVNKIGSFYIQQTNIQPKVFEKILSRITKNADLIKRIEYLEGEILSKETKNSNYDETKVIRESGRLCKESMELTVEIDKIRKDIKLVTLDSIYVPNTRPHQNIWSPDGEVHENAFVSNIGENNTKDIMMLNIDNHLKVLLLLGIGMFIENPNIQYMEIMKKLADEQRLFMIIASTDYIYGTNYQFCHGFIGKDLTNITPQKTLQAMGRIGRNNIQQDYTIRFRDDNMILKLFQKSDNNTEAINMCSLFSSY